MTSNEFSRYIQPRVFRTDTEDVLALEIINGPYRGVIYSYTTFDVLDDRTDDGMVRVRFSTRIHEPTNFVADVVFDEFCSDILVAWIELLSHEQSREQFETLLTKKGHGVH